MKPKPILTAIAVAVAALAQPAWAGFQFTQNEKGEVTHYNGIELPPIQTVEEAKAQAQKEIAAAKKASEAQQAVASTAENLQSEIGNQQFFYTGKPYLEETGQYLFLFRHYDPELARWTTADPSGFPDGANNWLYASCPTSSFDPLGLQDYTLRIYLSVFWSQQNNHNPIPLSIQTAAQIASLPASGATSAVLNAISSAAGAYASVQPEGPAEIRRASNWSEWVNGTPSAGKQYQNLIVEQWALQTPYRANVYWPTTDTSGSNFFHPLDSQLLAEEFAAGRWPPHPEIWHQESGGLAYPGTNQSIHTKLWHFSSHVDVILTVE